MARKLKVYEQSMSGSYSQVPTIILKGQWLKAAGFEVGQYVEIVCEGDKITLTNQLHQNLKAINLWPKK